MSTEAKNLSKNSKHKSNRDKNVTAPTAKALNPSVETYFSPIISPIVSMGFFPTVLDHVGHASSHETKTPKGFLSASSNSPVQLEQKQNSRRYA